MPAKKGPRMANPIEPTPTITGKSVDVFCRSITEARYDPEKAKYLHEARKISAKIRESKYRIKAELKP